MENLHVGYKVRIKKGESCYFIRPQDEWYQDVFTVAAVESFAKEPDSIQLLELLSGPLHDRLEKEFEEDPKYHFFGADKFEIVK
jgi:hypothetical protein